MRCRVKARRSETRGRLGWGSNSERGLARSWGRRGQGGTSDKGEATTGVRRGKGAFTDFFKKEARGKMMPEGLPRKVEEQGQEAGDEWGNFEKGELRSGAVETTGQHRT